MKYDIHFPKICVIRQIIIFMKNGFTAERTEKRAKKAREAKKQCR
jgi:hypothetical protein